MVTRRGFLGQAGAVGLAFGSLRQVLAAGGSAYLSDPSPFGEIRSDPRGLLDLPEGFTYTVISRVGETMDDGFFVPAAHDGMAAFPGSKGHTVLVRNHELAILGPSAFGPDQRLLDRLDPKLVFDCGFGKSPTRGGTTTLLYDTASQRLEGHWLSLAGTSRNCAGGPTPWNTWLTCEEHVLTADEEHEQDHGWVFEVPTWARQPTPPVPLRAMGRFNHEACAVEPNSGVVYMTEDRPDGLFYRFVPDRPGDLAAGGRLQALRYAVAPSLDTRNWHDFTQVTRGVLHAVDWVDLDSVESPLDDLRYRGFVLGAARFARGEGLWTCSDAIWFTCTIGGPKFAGQIWRYRPSPREGTEAEIENRATLELFVQPDDATKLNMADNLTVTPWGDLMVCEDGSGGNRMILVTQAGTCHTFANNARGPGEFAGACFSPDGSTLFCNLQLQGMTLAITGPWEKAAVG